MLKLYYTGADSYLAKQPNSDKSIGGFISSTEVPNDFGNNVFSDISLRTLENKLEECKLIALVNKSENAITNVEITIDYADKNTDVLVSLAQATLNGCEEAVFEKIGNMFSRPSNANFLNISSKFGFCDLDFVGEFNDQDEIEIFHNSNSIAYTIIQGDNVSGTNLLLQVVDAFLSNTNYVPKIVFDKEKNKDVLRISNTEKIVSGTLTVYKNEVITDISGSFSSTNFRSINISTIPANGLIGLWFRRTVKSQVFEKIEDMDFLTKNFGVYIFSS